MVTNKDICKMVDKAGRIALPCIETLGKVGLFERMVLTKMLKVRTRSKALVVNADSAAWNHCEDGKEGWSGEPEDGEHQDCR